MFTGITTAIGEIISQESLSSGIRYEISSPYDTSTIDIGASIAHDGVCLSVVSKTSTSYFVEVWQEALDLTTASEWVEGTQLNLERSLKVGDELGGHIVLGHVDSVAIIKGIEQEGDARRITLECPESLRSFVVPKGSVSLNGVSLTINKVSMNVFDILLISHTLSTTTWNQKEINDNVNLEIDMMARYAVGLKE